MVTRTRLIVTFIRTLPVLLVISRARIKPRTKALRCNNELMSSCWYTELRYNAYKDGSVLPRVLCGQLIVLVNSNFPRTFSIRTAASRTYVSLCNHFILHETHKYRRQDGLRTTIHLL
jgi:hypothetical protein